MSTWLRVSRVRDDGTFEEGTAEGGYDESGSGMLIRWHEIQLLDIFEAEPEGEGHD